MNRMGCIGIARNDSRAAKVVSALNNTGQPISPTVSSTARRRSPCRRNCRLKQEKICMLQAIETANANSIGIIIIPLSIVMTTYPNSPYTITIGPAAVISGTTTPRRERVMSNKIRMETSAAMPITRGISLPIHFIFMAVTQGKPVPLGWSFWYLSLVMICSSSFPVSTSGETAFLPLFHTESLGKVRNLRIIHESVPSLETSRSAICGFIQALRRIVSRLAASVGIRSGTICSIVIPSSFPTINSMSVSEVILSAYEMLSIISFVSSRMSSKFSFINELSHWVSTAAKLSLPNISLNSLVLTSIGSSSRKQFSHEALTLKYLNPVNPMAKTRINKLSTSHRFCTIHLP